MTDHDEMYVEAHHMDEQKPLIAKWIYVLFVCGIASMILSALNAIPVLSGAAGWISRIISVAAAVALFKLAPVNDRYRKAAIFSVVYVVGGIAVTVLNMNFFTMVISICAIIANYQELNAHSELVAPRDAKLSSRWHSLFYWELAVGLVTGFLSSAAVVIAVLADVDAEAITSVTVAVLSAINVVIGLFRILYLKKTVGLYRE